MSLNIHEYYDENTMGICPVCNGSCSVPLPVGYEHFKDKLYGYDPVTNTIPCNNCGGQKMFTKPSGIVLRRLLDGKPCEHKYYANTISNCYTRHHCMYCGDSYNIDSGD